MALKPGIAHTASFTVTASDLALHQGSGDLPVMATPRMVAFMEHAAMTAVQPYLTPEQTTVGASMQTTHLKPTAQGATVTAKATLTAAEGRKLTFTVEAHDAQGELLGKGAHTRFIVEREAFMAKLNNAEA